MVNATEDWGDKIKMRARSNREHKLENFFNTWIRNQGVICIRCHRSVIKGDKYRIESFYDGFGKFETVTHYDCREVKSRARLPIPRKMSFETNEAGTRRTLIMSAEETVATEETTAQKKSKKGAKKSSSKKSSSKASSKKGGAKKTAKKAARQPTGERTGSMAVTVGTRLAPLMKGNKKAAPIIRALSEGRDVSHKQLEALRDCVKDQCAALREAGKTSQASTLSATNSLVRRLERAAR